MAAFIMSSLAACMIVVLLALCIQFIRIEKRVADAALHAEAVLKKEYPR